MQFFNKHIFVVVGHNLRGTLKIITCVYSNMFEVHERKRIIINSTIIFSLVFFTSSIGIWKIQEYTTFFDDNSNKTENFKFVKTTEISFIDSNLILGAAGMLSLVMTLLYLTIKYVTRTVVYHDFDDNELELIDF